MKQKFSFPDLKFFIQKFVPEGKELIIGAKIEPGTGHLLMFGMGGILVDLYKDIAIELAPVTNEEAIRMTERTKASAFFNNYRGTTCINKNVILDILLRVSQMVCDYPAIKELDLNPVLAFSDSVCVVDARIILSF